jgi:hypothetical protein
MPIDDNQYKEKLWKERIQVRFVQNNEKSRNLKRGCVLYVPGNSHSSRIIFRRYQQSFEQWVSACDVY